MKKMLLVFALLTVSSALLADPQEVFGRSFMLTRPAHSHLNMQQHEWHNFIYTKKGNALGGLQSIVFKDSSMPQEKHARYFLINGKCELLVSGDDNVDEKKTRDIRAEWLGLPSDFHGKLSVSPKQQQMGFILEYHQDLKKFFDWKFFENSWVSASVPIVAVDNDLRFRQFDIKNTGTTFPHNLCDAFQNPEWLYGKISGKKSKVRAAELRLTLGRTFLDEDHFQIAYYSTLSLPLGNEQDPEYLFSPVAGYNGHIGLGTGVNFQILLNRHPQDIAWTFFLNVETLFLIRNKQLRTFDLRGKPWSRFMLFNRKDMTELNIPGVNVLTQEALVRPYNLVDASLGWRVFTNRFEVELGYSIWGHGDERVELRTPLDSPFITRCFDEFGIAGEAMGATASASTIDCRADDDTEFTSIIKTKVDLTSKENGAIDLESAQTGSAINHKVHFGMGIHRTGEKVAGFVGFGAYADLPQKNSSLRTWGLFGKLGATF